MSIKATGLHLDRLFAVQGIATHGQLARSLNECTNSDVLSRAWDKSISIRESTLVKLLMGHWDQRFRQIQVGLSRPKISSIYTTVKTVTAFTTDATLTS